MIKKIQIQYDKSEKIFDISRTGRNCWSRDRCRYNFFNDIGIIFSIENISIINKEN